MSQKHLLSFSVFILAVIILAVTVIRSSSVPTVYATQIPLKSEEIDSTVSEIDYVFPYQGKILPDSPLWVFKAIRDRILFIFTLNPLKKAELALLYSDKRLILSKTMFENNKPDLGLMTLSKGEKYLEIAMENEVRAREAKIDTTNFLIKLSNASLKHREVIENMMRMIPEDGKPAVVKDEDYGKNAYKFGRDLLNSKGIVPPKNPFDRL